jgi:hypothetical protein
LDCSAIEEEEEEEEEENSCPVHIVFSKSYGFKVIEYNGT